MSGIKQPLTYSGRSRGVDDARTVLPRKASKCAADGKKPWTVQYFSGSAPFSPGLANGRIDLCSGRTLSLKYYATHVANTKLPGQISTTPVGFVTAKGSPMAKALSGAADELIANGDHAKIFGNWGVGGIEITKPVLNPPTSF